MTRLRVLLAAAVIAALAGCATTEGDKEFQANAWETTKDTTDQVTQESVDMMKEGGGRLEGFFRHFWD
jgi:outer membrane protein assembly factor BamE (lipoprotein component of BamABCDE complex)